MSKYTTKIISKVEDFNSLKKTWNELLKESSNDTIFLTWEWQFFYFEAFGGDLFIVLIFEEEELIGILPFIRIRKIFFHIIKFNGVPDSDYLDFIIKRGFEESVLDYFFNQFLIINTNISIIELYSINEKSPLYSITNKIIANNYSLFCSEKICSYIPLPKTWDILWENFTSKQRYNLKSREDKLLKNFIVEVGVVENSDELKEMMKNFINLHQHKMTSIKRSGSFARKPFQNFHKKIAHHFLKKGFLKLYYLKINKKPVALRYLFCYKNKFLDYLSGFDLGYKKYSIGLLLLKQAIKDAIELGMSEFDFLRGDASYKFFWTENKRINKNFIIKQNILSVRIYLFTISVFKKIISWIKKIY